MIIKKAYQGEFKHLLSILRLAILDNRAYVAFSKRKFNYLPILKYLCENGIIESCEQRGEIIIVNLKQTYWKSFQIPVHAFYTVDSMRINKKSTANAKQITRESFRTGHFQHLIISSDRGIISGKEAMIRKVGGIPLFKIY